MGLIFPREIDEWRNWQQSRRRLRNLKNTILSPKPPEYWAYLQGGNPQLVIAIDSLTPTSISALLKPLQCLKKVGVLVISSVDLSSALQDGWDELCFHQREEEILNFASDFSNLRLACALGHFLPAGKLTWNLTQAKNFQFLVVQHGLLSPFAPPLPESSTLLAFSESDAHFWKSGRSDVSSEVVGAQIIWEAQQHEAKGLSSETPLFLGQLHGAEIRRSISTSTAQSFWKKTGGSYRPHPAEQDVLSRIQHRMWERQGFEIDKSTTSLVDLRRPVVSIFSTGVIEAAAAGIPSWVMCSKQISWVEEFWDRYGMSKWGSEPTAPPLQLKVEPALAIASSLQRILGSRT